MTTDTKDRDEAAEKSAELGMDCNCDPDHFFYGDVCWHYLKAREQYLCSFSRGWDASAARSAERIAELERALTMVVGSSLTEAEGHDWITCTEPSCLFARQALLPKTPGGA